MCLLGKNNQHRGHERTRSNYPYLSTAVILDLPGTVRVLFAAVSVTLVLVIPAFSALYFTIQALPDPLADGTGKTQMKIVGILGPLAAVTGDDEQGTLDRRAVAAGARPGVNRLSLAMGAANETG